MNQKTILLIEDNYLDVILIKISISTLSTNHIFHVAQNGLEALALLNGNSPEGTKIKPDIIILDLHMPKMNGIGFLRIIKNYSSLKNIKVFVITTSSEEYNLATAETLGITGYILKPLDFKNSKDFIGSPTHQLMSELLN